MRPLGRRPGTQKSGAPSLWIPGSRHRAALCADPLARPGMTMELLSPAQQKHALLAEHVPEPPRRVEPQGPAVEIERHRALHLDVDLIAELHEILDGAEMDVRRVVPGRRKILRARHVAANQELQPHLPEAEIR